MKEITNKSGNFTTKDKFNIKAGAHSLKDAVGDTLSVRSACIGKDTDADDLDVIAGAIVTDKGAYTTISATAVDLIVDLISLIDESIEEGNDANGFHAEVLVESRKSNAGRDYLVLTLV